MITMPIYNHPLTNARLGYLYHFFSNFLIKGMQFDSYRVAKSVSPVGIDMGISQLLSDDRSKTNNFQKRLLYLGQS